MRGGKDGKGSCKVAFFGFLPKSTWTLREIMKAFVCVLLALIVNPTQSSSTFLRPQNAALYPTNQLPEKPSTPKAKNTRFRRVRQLASTIAGDSIDHEQFGDEEEHPL